MNLRTVRKITFLIFIIFIFLLLFYMRSILKPILFSIVLAYILNPLYKYMIIKGVNKRLSALLTIILLCGFIGIVVFIIFPEMIKDLLGTVDSFNSYGSKITDFANNVIYNNVPKYFKEIIDSNIIKLESVASSYLNELFKQIVNCVVELPTYILAPVFIYYFLVDTEIFVNLIKRLIPIKARLKVLELSSEMDKIIGGFIRSQIILSLIVMVLTFFVLIFFKIRYPIVIAFINGVANVIPYFGPIIGLFPALLAALAESGHKAIMIGVTFAILQEIESSIIAPKIMGESIGMHPVFVICVLLIGGKYFGPLGLIISIPVGGVIKVAWNYLVRSIY